MITILIGLLALSLVIFVHELGHFFAARLTGVTVVSFSIGWGPVLLRKKIGDTEYRISALPIGGYCSMKGEHAYREAIEQNLDRVSSGSDTFFGTHPFKRLLISLAGPTFNLLFAVLVFTGVSAAGYEYQTWENRIVLASEYTDSGMLPADHAGLRTGDRITALDNTRIKSFADIQQYVADKGDTPIQTEILRGDMSLTTTVTPEIDRSTGAGKIGVFPWIQLVIGSVTEGSAAEFSGLKPDDVLVAIDGKPVAHLLELEQVLEEKPEQVVVSVMREEIQLRVPLVLLYRDDGSVETGISWKPENIHVEGTGFMASIQHGFGETARILMLTVKSIALLFGQVDVTQAVSGPVRITLMIGEVAQQGILAAAELLGIICISLFLMNLLPVPVLDGGTVLFSVIEMITRKPLRPRLMYRIQFIGIGFILFVFIFALFGDISYLIK